MPGDQTDERAALTSRVVIEEALALADEDGLDAVTIRRLAARLGVTPMAIYWHVRNKDELLNGVAASILEMIDPTVDVSLSWQQQLRSLLGSMLDVLRAHPAAASLLTTRTASTEGSLQVTEVALDILRRGGFSPVEATQVMRHALATLTNLVSGEPGIVMRNEPAQAQEERAQARHVLATLPATRFPRLVEAAGPLSEAVEPEAYFTFGLDLLMAGIEAIAKV